MQPPTRSQVGGSRRATSNRASQTVTQGSRPLTGSTTGRVSLRPERIADGFTPGTATIAGSQTWGRLVGGVPAAAAACWGSGRHGWIPRL